MACSDSLSFACDFLSPHTLSNWRYLIHHLSFYTSEVRERTEFSPQITSSCSCCQERENEEILRNTMCLCIRIKFWSSFVRQTKKGKSVDVEREKLYHTVSCRILLMSACDFLSLCMSLCCFMTPHDDDDHHQHHDDFLLLPRSKNLRTSGRRFTFDAFALCVWNFYPFTISLRCIFCLVFVFYTSHHHKDDDCRLEKDWLRTDWTEDLIVVTFRLFTQAITVCFFAFWFRWADSV